MLAGDPTAPPESTRHALEAAVIALRSGLLRQLNLCFCVLLGLKPCACLAEPVPLVADVADYVLLCSCVG